jgi:hypothetical protein
VRGRNIARAFFLFLSPIFDMIISGPYLDNDESIGHGVKIPAYYYLNLVDEDL